MLSSSLFGMKHNKTPFTIYQACEGGHTSTLTEFIRNKADLNKYSPTGKSPLGIAIENRQANIVKLLIDAKVDVNLPSHYRWIFSLTPLQIAMSMPNKKIIQMLLTANANTHLKEPTDGFTALHIAVTYFLPSQDLSDPNGFDPECFKTLLLHEELDPNVADSKSEGTPFWWACRSGNLDAVKMLLDCPNL